MYIDPFNLCLIVAEIILYVFHFTVFLLLIVERKNKFSGAFYDLMRLIFVADFVFIIAFALNFGFFLPAWQQFQIRLPNFRVWPEFYKSNGNLAAIILNTTGYCAFVQFFAHGLIAFNRFTIFWFPMMHKKIWSKPWYTFAVIILPLIVLSHRLFEPGVFTFNENNDVFARFLNDNTRTIAYYITSSVFSFMTIVQAIFNILAVVKYYYFKKLNTHVDSNEARLLSLSCVLFFIQWLRCAHNFGRLIFPQNEFFNLLLQTILPLVSDLYAWTGSISLILLSLSTRKAYLKFFLKCININKFTFDSTNIPQYPITFNTNQIT